MIDWPEKTLGEICEKITDGAHSSPKSVLIGKPMASVKDLNSFGVDLISARKIAEEDYQKLVKQGCKPCIGDVLIAKDGNTALDTVCVQKENEDFVLLSSVAILRPNNREVMPDFLKYYFSNRITISYLKSNFISGAAIPRVVLKDFKKAVITLPPLSKQRAIVSVLSALDDKIENNRQMNETLEEMARAIFKSWFVDFDPVHAKAAGNAPAHMDAETAALFPSSFGDDGLPAGWGIKKLENISDLGWGDLNTTKKSYVEAGFDAYSASGKDGKLPHFDFEKLGVVLSAIGANSGRTWLARGKWSCIKNTIRFWSKYELTPTVFLFHSTNGRNFWPLRGSAQPFISQGDARSQKIVVPGNGEAISFERIVGRYYEKISTNEAENQTLAELRDTLLPKLMSGEIRVTDAEREVEGAL